MTTVRCSGPLDRRTDEATNLPVLHDNFPCCSLNHELTSPLPFGQGISVALLLVKKPQGWADDRWPDREQLALGRA